MKTLKLYAALVLSTVLLLSVGCRRKGENAVVEPQPEEKPCFKFEILETAKTSVTFRVTPTAEDVPYVLMMVDKTTFDAFESVEAYIADDLMWFDEVAMGMGITLDDYLATMLNRGVKEDSSDGLAPDTAYYLYAYRLTRTGVPRCPRRAGAEPCQNLYAPCASCPRYAKVGVYHNAKIRAYPAMG